MSLAIDFLTRFALNAAWQVLAIVAVAQAGSWIMRRAAARYQHALWTVAAGLAVLIPLAVIAPWTAALPDAGLPALAVPSQMPMQPQPIPSGFSQAWEWEIPAGTIVRLIVLLAIGLVALFRLVRCIWGLMAANGIRRRSTPLEGAPTDLRVTTELEGPATIGIRQPVILGPRWFWEQPRELIEAALAHERAHIRRRDYLRALLHEILLLPVAFHPATTWLRRRLEESREMACDEMAAETLRDARSYARSLVAIAEKVPQAGWAPALGVTDGGILEERVARLLRGTSRARMAICAGLLFALCGAGAISFGRLMPVEPDLAADHRGVVGEWRGQAVGFDLTMQLRESDGTIAGSTVMRYDPQSSPTLLSMADLRAAGYYPALPPPPPPPPPPPAEAPPPPPPAKGKGNPAVSVVRSAPVVTGQFRGAEFHGRELSVRVHQTDRRQAGWNLRITGENEGLLTVETASGYRIVAAVRKQ